MSTVKDHPHHASSPETKAIRLRHPAPWRQVEALTFEHSTGKILPDPVTTAGLHLVCAPSTPVSNIEPFSPDALRERLESLRRQQQLRRLIYGQSFADESRPGHTPVGLKQELHAKALAELDTDTSSEDETNPASAVALYRDSSSIYRRIARPISRQLGSRTKGFKVSQNISGGKKSSQALSERPNIHTLRSASGHTNELLKASERENNRALQKRKRSHDETCGNLSSKDSTCRRLKRTHQ